MSTQVITKELITTHSKSKSAISHGMCAGCGYGLIIRILAECIDELGIQGRTVTFRGIGCSGGIPGNILVDGGGGAHGHGTDMGTAIKRLHPDCIVITCQGDGDQGAIGLGTFLSSLLRAENITSIFCNNAGYGRTGGQMAPTTILGQATTTSSTGRDAKLAGYPLHLAELAATFRGVAYSARVSVHTPANYARAKRATKTAIEKQIKGIGYGMVEFLSACPSGWRMTPRQSWKFVDEKILAEYPLGVFKDVDKIE